jgi:hypothetical protein
MVTDVAAIEAAAGVGPGAVCGAVAGAQRT